MAIFKMKRFQKLLREKDIDLALITNLYNKDPNMFYFTGHMPQSTFLLIPKKGNSKILTNKMEFEMMKKFSGIKDVEVYKKPAMEFLANNINRYGKNIGINKEIISLNEFKSIKKLLKGMKFIDISRNLLENRKTKDPDEIKNIKKACKIADNIFTKLINNFNFKTEKDIEDFMRIEANKNGSTMSFDPIVASGKSSSIPHYRGKNVKLRNGFLLLDFGVNYNGYLSDMTRTIYLGTPNKKEIEAYNLLLKVQKQAIKKAEPGMKVKELMQSVIDSLGEFKENFIHGLGHGIGVEIHELPSLHSKSKDILCENDVFTIEPGIYFENKFGIRIEDDVLILKDKNIILTKSTKELIVKKRW